MCNSTYFSSIVVVSLVGGKKCRFYRNEILIDSFYGTHPCNRKKTISKAFIRFSPVLICSAMAIVHKKCTFEFTTNKQKRKKQKTKEKETKDKREYLTNNVLYLWIHLYINNDEFVQLFAYCTKMSHGMIRISIHYFIHLVCVRLITTHQLSQDANRFWFNCCNILQSNEYYTQLNGVQLCCLEMGSVNMHIIKHQTTCLCMWICDIMFCYLFIWNSVVTFCMFHPHLFLVYIYCLVWG